MGTGHSTISNYNSLQVKNDGVTRAEQLYLNKQNFFDTHWNTSTEQNKAGDIRKLNGLVVGGKCPANTSLSGFKMIRRRGKTNSQGRLPPEWAYRYKCTENPERQNCQIRTTSYTESSDYNYGQNKFYDRTTLGDLRKLAHHNVMCRDGESLGNFQLEKSPDNSRIRYKYTCCENPTNNCVNMSTPVFKHVQGDPHYLRKANIQCPPSTVLTGKKLVDLGWNNFKYNFKCCAPITEVNCNAFWRNPEKWPAPDEQHDNNCPLLLRNCKEGKTCGGTRETPDNICIKDQGSNTTRFIKVGDIPKLDPASMQRAEDTLLRGSNTNYYQLCKYWLNNNNPSKTWQSNEPNARKCTSFCQNYIVYNPNSFKGRKSRTEIEGFPLWKIKGLEES